MAFLRLSRSAIYIYAMANLGEKVIRETCGIYQELSDARRPEMWPMHPLGDFAHQQRQLLPHPWEMT